MANRHERRAEAALERTRAGDNRRYNIKKMHDLQGQFRYYGMLERGRKAHERALYRKQYAGKRGWL